MPRTRNTLILIGVGIVVLAAVWYFMNRSATVPGTVATTTDNIVSLPGTTNGASGSVTVHTTKPPAGTPAPTGLPHIAFFAPAAGTVGTTVMIQGTGFDKTTNYILFGTSNDRHRADGTPDNQIAVLPSPDGKTITFTVPASGPSGILCDSNNHCVAISAIATVPGNYPVQVRTKNGLSNIDLFVVAK